MQHVTISEKSLLLGNEAARLLLDYAAALASNSKADTVVLNAISSDGDEVVATFLLNEGSNIVAESATTTVAEPDNRLAEDYMATQLRLIEHPPGIVADDAENAVDFDHPVD